MCEHDLAAMTLNHFEYDDAYAWYHFQCQSCGKRRLVSISLDDVVNEQADGNVYEKITTKDLK